MLVDNLRIIEENIQAACNKADRKRGDVTLVAVSKTKPVEMIKELYDAGIRQFGENKVQELVSKRDQLPADIQWHLIGHLQRNKVKQVISKVALIHSVDSYRLAEEINIQSKKNRIRTNVLIEVNISGEDSKFGVIPKETEKLIREISVLDGIRIKGLMTIAPYTENPENNRLYFRNLKQLSVDMKSKNIDNVCMDVLSMGMTGDYEIAIEEGATIVRVGTGLFGQRNYE
ncbi:YggS family pyridoxal phosphate-dependent enzyme [Parasporobacterium paucivorans]|uniref:Pyridoxal phosphate homeostasis protein n=1 Tax=Parasporobacterium paucivorans DSM 15970 TaxID=1122934 RepID=A0A1M6A3D8_9FIRM|nr:YggS family pyridoxal phosphate-dependent enzyme [Parasporobacterium paucivorans]SHI31024.1 hypothetical protein SAMN02745691_00050 [Parasporobacterium paucivorans DSM 15970]